MPTGIRKAPSGKWVADITLDGRRRKKSFDTQREAQVWRSEQESTASKGKWIDPRLSKITVGEWRTQWVAAIKNHPTLADATKRGYEWRVSAIPEGDLSVPLASVTDAMIERWLHAIAHSTSPSSANTCLPTIKLMFNAAVKERYLLESPCADVKKLKDKRREMVIPTADELEAICAELPVWAERAVRGLAYLGCRSSDLINITPEDVVLGPRLVVRDRKTDGKPRALPLVGEVRLIVESAGDREFIFDGFRGGRIQTSELRKEWHAARRAAGVRHMRLHDLRHYCASRLIAAGHNPVQVAAWLGHSTPTQTLNTYSHLFPNDMESMALTLGGVDAMDERQAL